MTVIDEEIKLDRHKYIMSRTDLKGNIQFANDYFVAISGYSLPELLGKPHSIIRHPDMPKVIFKMMWERLKSGESIMALVKNRSKDGRYYWVTTQFEIKTNIVTKEKDGYMAYRQAAHPSAVQTIAPLYAELLQIEQEQGIEAAELYLKGYLESKNTTYDDFVKEAAKHNGAMSLFFIAMKKFFGSK